MPPEHESLLPVLSSSLGGESLRADLARNDLIIIAAKAQEQVAVHQYATHAATEVIHTVARTQLPNQEKLQEMISRHSRLHEAEDPGQKSAPMTAGKVARQIITPDKSRTAGVSEKDIKRDILAELHPDREAAVDVSTDDASQDEAVYRSVTEAQQHEDEVLTQGLYAATVASRALETEGLGASALEKTRYKAWIALKAGEGRFSTQEEVDAWRDREIGLLPVRARTGLVIGSINAFAKALGADDEGEIAIPVEYRQAIVEGMDDTRKAVEWVMGEKITTDDAAEIDTDLLDTRIGNLLDRLDLLLDDRQDSLLTLISPKGQRASAFCRELSEIARILHPEHWRYKALMKLGSMAYEASYGGSYKGGYPTKDLFHDDQTIIKNKNQSKYYSEEDSIFGSKY
jgi:hypothetical protein